MLFLRVLVVQNKVKYEASVNSFCLADFDEDKKEETEMDVIVMVEDEGRCPNCGLIDQDAEYQSICSFCGHLK